MMTRWNTGQQQHDWFVEPCQVLGTLQIAEGSSVRKGRFLGPFTLDQAVAALWQVRSWTAVCNCTVDDGTGSVPFFNNGTYIAQWESPLPDERFLNEVDLSGRFVQPVTGGLLLRFLDLFNFGVIMPGRVVFYNGNDGLDTPGYYLVGFLGEQGISATGYDYNTALNSGINVSWSLGIHGSISLPLKKASDSDTNVYGGTYSISPRTFWPY